MESSAVNSTTWKPPNNSNSSSGTNFNHQVEQKDSQKENAAEGKNHSEKVKDLQEMARFDNDTARQISSQKLSENAISLNFASPRLVEAKLMSLRSYNIFCDNLEINSHPISNFKIDLYITSIRPSSSLEIVQQRIAVLKKTQLATNLLWPVVDIDINRLEMETLNGKVLKPLKSKVRGSLEPVESITLHNYLIELPSIVDRLRSLPSNAEEQEQLITQYKSMLNASSYSFFYLGYYQKFFENLELPVFPISHIKITLFLAYSIGCLASRLQQVLPDVHVEGIEKVGGRTLERQLSTMRFLLKAQKTVFEPSEDRLEEESYQLRKKAILNYELDLENYTEAESTTLAPVFDANKFPLLSDFDTKLFQSIREMRIQPLEFEFQSTFRVSASKLIKSRSQTSGNRLTADLKRYEEALDRCGIPSFPISPIKISLVIYFFLPIASSRLFSYFPEIFTARSGGNIDQLMASMLILKSANISNLESSTKEGDWELLEELKEQLKLYIGQEIFVKSAESKRSKVTKTSQASTEPDGTVLPLELSKIPILAQFDRDSSAIIAQLQSSTDPNSDNAREKCEDFANSRASAPKNACISALKKYKTSLESTGLSTSVFPITIDKITIFFCLSIFSQCSIGVQVRHLAQIKHLPRIAISTVRECLAKLALLRESQFVVTNLVEQAKLRSENLAWKVLRSEMTVVMDWCKMKEETLKVNSDFMMLQSIPPVIPGQLSISKETCSSTFQRPNDPPEYSTRSEENNSSPSKRARIESNIHDTSKSISYISSSIPPFETTAEGAILTSVPSRSLHGFFASEINQNDVGMNGESSLQNPRIIKPPARTPISSTIAEIHSNVRSKVSAVIPTDTTFSIQQQLIAPVLNYSTTPIKRSVDTTGLVHDVGTKRVRVGMVDSITKSNLLPRSFELINHDGEVEEDLILMGQSIKEKVNDRSNISPLEVIPLSASATHILNGEIPINSELTCNHEEVPTLLDQILSSLDSSTTFQFQTTKVKELTSMSEITLNLDQVNKRFEASNIQFDKIIKEFQAMFD